MKRRKKMIAEAVAVQAIKAIRSGSRFQVRKDIIGDDIEVRRLISRMAVSSGANVRVNEFQGLLTFYGDNADDGTSITIATVG